MRLKKFQINNYKSIKQFPPCWLAEDITIFAGKNESGKTAALQALSDFDTELFSLREDATPLEDDTLRPELQLWFDISADLRLPIFEGTGVGLNKACQEYLDKHGFPLVKDYEGNYSIGDDFETLLNDSIKSEINSALKKAHICLVSLISADGRFASVENIDEETDFTGLKNKINQIVNQQQPKAQNGEPQPKNESFDKETQEIIQSLFEILDFLIELKDYDTILDRVLKHIPKFVFFDSFDNALPYEIPLGEVEKHPALVDFLKVANIDIEQVRSTTDELKRANLLKNKSATISGNFKGYWQQDEITLTGRVSGDKFIFEIGEDKKTYSFKPAQRSKGFQWFLSFYLRLKAENVLGTEKQAILLIDEPGLYLHATAQEDVLSVLESLANNGAQIVFSTHSPYLLDTLRFDRIKLVTKDWNKESGTVVHDKIHKNSDRDTITPLITALGYDIVKDSSLVRDRNVLLEGMSDYYFLVAMAEYLGMSEAISNISLMPCKGASQIHLVASILFGWGLNFIVILDNDKEGKKTSKGLREVLDVPEEKIILISEELNAEIEDLFNAEDFTKYIWTEGESDSTKSNSKLIKNAEKVLLAKNFLDKIRGDKSEITLSDSTRNNFIELLTKISKAFELHDGTFPIAVNDADQKQKIKHVNN